MGRFLDDLPQLKEVLVTNMNLVLNNIRKEKWGIQFLFKLGLRLEQGDISKGNEEDEIVGKVILARFSHFQDLDKHRYSTIDRKSR